MQTDMARSACQPQEAERDYAEYAERIVPTLTPAMVLAAAERGDDLSVWYATPAADLAQLPRSFGQFRARRPLSPLFVMRRFMFGNIVTKIRAISVDEYGVKCDH